MPATKKALEPPCKARVSRAILVLMEYGLELAFLQARDHIHSVLILVLMEYGLEFVQKIKLGKTGLVLILVLMEYGLEFPRIGHLQCHC